MFSEWIGKPPVTLGGYAAFPCLKPMVPSSLPSRELPLASYILLSWGNETCDILSGVPVHICDLHLSRAKDAGHIVLDINV